MAVRSVKSSVKSLIHHSDRGMQYCSNAYVGILEQTKIQISMTEQKDDFQNVFAERFNGILKGELGLDQSFTSSEYALFVGGRSVQIYNEERPHMNCNMLTPEQTHLGQGKLPRKWKNYCKKKKVVQE